MKKRILYGFVIAACLLLALPGTARADTPAAPTANSTNIYANGMPLIIADGGLGDNSTATIYIDTNGNGEIDTGEQSLSEAGVSGAPADGVDLCNYTIYGGFGNAACEGNTKITMLGGTVSTIYGGGGGFAAATVTGNTEVTVSGGTVRGTIYGGGWVGAVSGDTTVTISTGALGVIYGGGNKGAVNGNTTVTVSGGEFSYLYGGGYDTTATVGGNATVTVSGGNGVTVCGGGDKARVSGSTSATMSGGTVSEVIGGGTASTATVGSDCTVVITQDAVVAQTVKSGGFNAGTVSDAISLTVEAPTAVRTGYTFVNWFTDWERQTPVTYTSGTYTMTTDGTLYTEWTKNTYIVLFEGNGSTGGSMDGQAFLYDDSQRLSANQFTKEHNVTYAAQGGEVTPENAASSCEFFGWAASESGDKVYDNQGWARNLTAENNGNVTLYALWGDTYAPITLPTPTRTGYGFNGWYTEAEGGTKAGDSGDSYTPESSLTLYANWTANDYTVTFDGEGVTADPASRTVTYDSAYGTLPEPTKAGFNFAGWWTGGNGTGTQITAANTVTTADNHTLYAKWTEKTVVSITQTEQSYTYDGTAKAFAITGTPDTGFTVTYNQGAGNLSPVNPGSYNVVITRAEDATYAEFGITIGSGLIINAATIDIATISGVTAPERGAVPVSAITETVQFTGAVIWTPEVTGAFAASTEYTATITLTPKTGFTLTGVTADFFTVTGAASDNNDTDSGVITAVFPITDAAPSDNGGGNTGGGGSETTPPATNELPTEFTADITSGGDTYSTLPVTVDTESRTATVDIGSAELTQEGTTITVASIPDVDKYKVGIPVPSLSTMEEHGTLTLNTDSGSVTVPSNMLTGVTEASGTKAEIYIGQGDKSALPDDVKASIGDKPLISLTMSIDGVHIDWSNPNAPVTVSIPYTPTAAELINPEAIVIWYIDGSGNIQTVVNGHYDVATGTVVFSTTHFSDYAVAYYPVSFADVVDTAWYAPAVTFIAAREITSGTGNGTTYSPEAKLTRGEFIVLMMRAYGISPDENPTENFSDAGNTYYTGYLAAAKRLGISAGVGNNMYAPTARITRQEMFTLLYNALEVIDQMPEGDSGRTVADFSDASDIALWAREAMTFLVKTGTVGGSGGKLTPADTTTRAEMAQVLYNLLRK